MSFDHSTKLLFPISSQASLHSGKSIHPQVEQEQAESIMNAAVERMHQWQEKKRTSNIPSVCNNFYLFRKRDFGKEIERGEGQRRSKRFTI